MNEPINPPEGRPAGADNPEPQPAPVPRIVWLHGRIIMLLSMIAGGFCLLMGLWSLLIEFGWLGDAWTGSLSNTMPWLILTLLALLFFHIGLNLQRGLRWGGLVLGGVLVWCVGALCLVSICAYLGVGSYWEPYANTHRHWDLAGVMAFVLVLLLPLKQVYRHWGSLRR